MNGAVEPAPRDKVNAEVTLSVQPVEPVKIYFKSFDVDDPTAEDNEVDNDTVAGAEDNRGASPAKAGKFTGEANGVLEKAFDAKTATIEFQVTMQPGDNFRIVGNGDKDFVLQLANDDHAQNVGDSNEDRNKNKQRIVHPAVFGSPVNQEVRFAEKYVSDVLTVWRFMHVEVDSMEAVPAAPHPQANTLDRVIFEISGNNDVAQWITLTADIAGANYLQDSNGDGTLDVEDFSGNLSAPAPDTGWGRFENGWVRVGSGAAAVTTNGLDGNGEFSVHRAAGITIPFSVSKQGVQGNATGNVIALSGTTFSLKEAVAESLKQEHNGGVINVAGVAMTITGVDTMTKQVTVAAVNDIPVRLHDDDIDSLLPRDPHTDFMQASDNRLENLYADAYIRPVYDGGGDPANDTHDVPFILNTKHPDALDWDSRDNNSQHFWVVYILSAFQNSANALKNDGDPNSEFASAGWTIIPGPPLNYQGGGSLIYLETIRERIPFANTRPGEPLDLERRTVPHEVGHAFHLTHGNNQDDLPSNGIMNRVVLGGPTYGGPDFRFVDRDLDTLRGTEKPHS